MQDAARADHCTTVLLQVTVLFLSSLFSSHISSYARPFYVQLYVHSSPLAKKSSKDDTVLHLVHHDPLIYVNGKGSTFTNAVDAYMSSNLAKEHGKLIPVSVLQFISHVQDLHANWDTKFEEEYEVCSTQIYAAMVMMIDSVICYCSQ